MAVAADRSPVRGDDRPEDSAGCARCIGSGPTSDDGAVTRSSTAFLEWTASGPTARVRDGADSFVIRDGQIVVETIHYTVEPITGA